MERARRELGRRRAGRRVQAPPLVSRIICNSGPLIALGILGRLDILKSLFDEVLVPETVQKEIEQGGVKLSGLEDFRRADWIRVVPPREKSDELLESLLDIGEAAVISLAREQKAVLVLIRAQGPQSRPRCLRPATHRHGAHFGRSQKEKPVAGHRRAISKAPAGRLLDSRFDCPNRPARSRRGLNFLSRRQSSNGRAGNRRCPGWMAGGGGSFRFQSRQNILFSARAFTDKNSTASNSTDSTGRRGFPTESATAAAWSRRRFGIVAADVRRLQTNDYFQEDLSLVTSAATKESVF
jgi:hypothetical protein